MAMAGTHIAYTGSAYPVCFGNIFPPVTYEYFTDRHQGSGPIVSASTNTTGTHTIKLNRLGYGNVSGTSVVSTGSGGATYEGRYHSASKHWYKTNNCTTIYDQRFCAGKAEAEYNVTAVSTGGGSKFVVDFSVTAYSHFGNVYPCGEDEFDNCDDSTGLKLALQEQITVSLYAGATLVDSETFSGGGTVDRGATTDYGYVSSIFENDQEVLNDPCEAPFPDSHTKFLAVNESGETGYELAIPVGVTKVYVSHCYWMEAVPSPSSTLTCKVICFADLNGDGAVDNADLLIFLDAYEDGIEPADINGDGGVTSDDLLEFLLAFENGC